MDYKWYDFILKMHTLYQGTHVHLEKVTRKRYILNSRFFSSFLMACVVDESSVMCFSSETIV